MIRAATPDDAEAIAAIWNDVIRNSAVTFTSAEKTQPEITALIADRPVFVAVDAGRVQGFAHLGPFRSGPGYARAGEHTIYLTGAAQGRGIGRSLMAQIEAAAIARGVDRLIAALNGNNAGAIAFHLRLGFEKAGFFPSIGEKFGMRHDLVLLQKNLNSMA